MAKGRQRTAPHDTSEWTLRAQKVVILRKAHGFHSAKSLLESDIWTPLLNVSGLNKNAYYKYESAKLCFQNYQLQQISKLFKIDENLLIDASITLEEFIDIIKWKWILIEGSSFSTVTGPAHTLTDNTACDEGWFSGPSTIILGHGTTKSNNFSKTIAKWEIKTEYLFKNKIKYGYILIGCIRHFGGLHSSEYGSIVEIFFNSKKIDIFSLMTIPEGYTDYFYKQCSNNIPFIPITKILSNIYIWSIDNNLFDTETQDLTITIDSHACWDIDYIGITWAEDILNHA